jgi:hypothetical protein
MTACGVGDLRRYRTFDRALSEHGKFDAGSVDGAPVFIRHSGQSLAD